MDLRRARIIATNYAGRMLPFCERIQIAGSVRRQQADVKDIEIVLVPKMNQVRDMFGQLVREESALEGLFDTLRRDEGELFLKDGKRYKQIELQGLGYRGVRIDVFIVRPPAQWGVILTIRTGPADFSKRIVTQRLKGGLLPDDCYVSEGQVWRNGLALPMPEEQDFFALLNMEWIPPEKRR